MNNKGVSQAYVAPSSKNERLAVFSVFALAGLIAAAFAPIQDCDEVFNYWEPSHLLNHGYGRQTWEYSPEFGIRSWAYAGLHALIVFIGQRGPFIVSKISEFYFVRSVFAVVCALCQTRLYVAVERTIGRNVAVAFAIISVTSAGMYHASVAYLPSSFAMYTVMMGTATFLESVDGEGTAEGIFWFAIGSLLGWPFAGALLIPFLLAEACGFISAPNKGMRLLHFLDGAMRCLLFFTVQCLLDSILFDKPSFVPWNIVAYNVFSSSDRGPNIYGTEPWHFYLRNLALNFHLWLPLALLQVPLALLQSLAARRHGLSVSGPRLASTLAVALWLAIFTTQPHKEERFLYPIYPLLALNAALAFHTLLTLLRHQPPTSFLARIPAPLQRLAVLAFLVLGALLGLARVAGLATAYAAPLQVYAPLEALATHQPEANVCLGKEWYRFPSSYFLPDGHRAQFVRSAFDGLLPGEFAEWREVSELLRATARTPPGMNDRNEWDAEKVVPLDWCDFMVDSRFPGVAGSALEPDYIADTATWERVKCAPFLDAARTGPLGRMFWTPEWSIVPAAFRREWGEYCLLRRRS